MEIYIGTELIEATPMSMEDAQLLGYPCTHALPYDSFDGYAITYTGGRKLWMNKTLFERTYHRPGLMGFSEVIHALQWGYAVRRKNWRESGTLVIKLEPNWIKGADIQSMKSLPDPVKELLLRRDDSHIVYTDQMLLIYPDGRAESWMPTISDIFAKDWECVLDETL